LESFGQSKKSLYYKIIIRTSKKKLIIIKIDFQKYQKY